MDRRHEARRITGALLLAGGLAVLTACGNLTAGGIGEASVVMSGDAPDESTAPQTAIVSQPASIQSWQPAGTDTSSSGPAPTDHDDAEGQLEADLTVYLVSAEGELTPVTDGEVEVRLDLDGVEEPEIGSRTVTATSYSALRMVFTEIEAQVEAGLIIDGQPVTGPIDVEIDDVTLTVEKSLSLEVAEGERVELLIDLNAESWLLAVDPVTSTVDAQTFADLVTVRVR